jgi:predicted HAD superfamily Cof-like phosphohydrolase
MTSYEMILEFNKSYGVQTNTEKQLDLFVTNPKLVAYRLSLILEEGQELQEAVKYKNFIEIIDALTDIEYVVLGAYTAFGVNADDVYDLEKQLDLNDEYSVQLTHQVQSNIFETNPTLLNDLVTLMGTNIKNLESAIENKDFEQTIDSLNNIRYVTLCFYVAIGIDADEAFDIVHRSNMSKLCRSEDEAKDTVEWYKKNETRYDTPASRLSDCGNYWVVFNESTKKILKNINYTPANFDSILNSSDLSNSRNVLTTA